MKTQCYTPSRLLFLLWSNIAVFLSFSLCRTMLFPTFSFWMFVRPDVIFPLFSFNKVPDCKRWVAFSNMLMYFTLHRVHLTNKQKPCNWTKLQECVHENIWRNIYLYSVGNNCLFSISHLKRKFRFIKCVICRVLSLVSPSTKHKYSVKWDTGFTVVLFLVLHFFFMISASIYCNMLPEHSGSVCNQQPKQ